MQQQQIEEYEGKRGYVYIDPISQMKYFCPIQPVESIVPTSEVVDDTHIDETHIDETHIDEKVKDTPTSIEPIIEESIQPVRTTRSKTRKKKADKIDTIEKIRGRKKKISTSGSQRLNKKLEELLKTLDFPEKKSYRADYRTIHSGPIRTFLDITNNFVNVITITCLENGLSIRAHATDIVMNVTLNNFSGIHLLVPGKKFTIGVSNLYKALKSIKNNRILDFIIGDSDDELRISIRESNSISVYDIRVTDTLDVPYSVPIDKYDRCVIIKSSFFHKKIKTSYNIDSEQIQIISMKDRLICRSKNETIRFKDVLKATKVMSKESTSNISDMISKDDKDVSDDREISDGRDVSDDPTSSKLVDRHESVIEEMSVADEDAMIIIESNNSVGVIRATYPVRFFNIFTKCENMSSYVKLYFSRNMPMAIEYNIGDLGLLTCLLAPIKSQIDKSEE
jgi:hypothetical protein